MNKKTVFLMWITLIGFIMIVIPYIQNAGGGPSSQGISFFMGYYKINDFPECYLYIITMGIIEGILITLLLQSVLNNYKEGDNGIDKFDLNQ